MAWLTESFSLPFMQRALVIALIVGAVGGVLSAYVVIRRLAFFADTLTHTVFPGVAIASVLVQPLWIGALIAGLASTLAFTFLSRQRLVEDNAAMAVILTTFFAVGVMVVSRVTTFTNDLITLLFGQILTVDRGDIMASALLGGCAVLLTSVLHRELVARAFDPEGSAAAGRPVWALDLALNVAVTLVVVAALRAVGTVLVLALLVTPAATIRPWVRGVVPMAIGGALVGMSSGVIGLVIAYQASVERDVRLAPGATIVLVMTTVFALGSLAVWARRSIRHRVST